MWNELEHRQYYYCTQKRFLNAIKSPRFPGSTDNEIRENLDEKAFKYTLIEEFAMVWEDKNEVLIDERFADKHSREYLARLQGQITARGLILQETIQDYNSFLALPPSSSAGAAIFELAFAVLSTAVPLFRVGKFISEANERATVALNAAKAFGNTAKTTDKVVKGVTGALPKIAEGGTLVKNTREIEVKAKKIPTDSPELERLRRSKMSPVIKIIKELDAGTELWDTATDVILFEFANRMRGNSINPSRLEQIIDTLLPPPPKTFSAQELEQIKFRYLHLMIKEHVKLKPIVRVEKRTRYDNGQYVSSWSIDGWNDKQVKTIEEWFGRETSRGLFFSEPFIKSAMEYLGNLPSQIVTQTRTDMFSPTAKW